MAILDDEGGVALDEVWIWLAGFIEISVDSTRIIKCPKCPVGRL